MMTARSWWSVGPDNIPHAVRRLILLLLAAAITTGVGGCSTPTTQPAAVQTVTTVVTVTETPQEIDSLLDEARQSVGPPSVEVVELTLDAARRVDYIRHQASRGEEQQQAITDTQEVLTFLEDAQITLVQAAEDVDQDLPGVTSTAMKVSRAAEEIAVDVAAEIEWIMTYVALDAALAEVVANWDSSGTRSEMETNLGALVAQAQTVLTQAQGLQPFPAPCTGLRDNRIGQAQVVLDRTQQLRDATIGREGLRFDELLASFTAQPLGEDPVAQDAATRSCWAEQSSLVDAQTVMTTRLDELEQALSK